MDSRAETRLRKMAAEWERLTILFNKATEITLSDHKEPYELLDEIKDLSANIGILANCYTDLVRYPYIMTAQEFIAKLYHHNGSSMGKNGELILLFDYNWSSVGEIGRHDLHSLAFHHGQPIKSGRLLGQAEQAVKNIHKHTAISSYAPLWVGGCKPRRAVTNLIFASEQDKPYFTVKTQEIE